MVPHIIVIIKVAHNRVLIKDFKDKDRIFRFEYYSSEKEKFIFRNEFESYRIYLFKTTVTVRIEFCA